MSPSQRIWLTGLRRAWTVSGALSRWTAEKQITGAVWTPASYEIEDLADGLVRLAAAGAKADTSLLWDFMVVDVRAAADVLSSTYRDSDGRTGYVAAWLDPARVKDAGKAGRELIGDVRRANVAAALVWTPERAKAVEDIVAAGVPVALSGVRDASARDAVASARNRGMARCREDATKRGQAPEGVPEIPVFLLGAEGEDGEDAVFAASLTTELALHSSLPPGGGLPLSVEAEQNGARSALDALTKRAAEPARDDSYHPASFATVVAREAAELTTDDVLADIWARDHTAWKEDPTEIADRLGWLDAPELMARELSSVQEFARNMRSGGKINHIVLCGMGGSSLAPETFRSVLGGGMPLTVVDTTDPDHIAAVTASLDMEQTLFVIASKSGTTVETSAQLEHFWKLSGRGDRFVAITDAGTPLASLARERDFVRVFENPPDIGGRFSGLSYFGLVPAALAGADPAAIVDGARRSMLRNGPGASPSDAPGIRLGAALGESKLTEARDKLTLILPGPLSAFGAWIEQLIAESTGKEGNGVLPVLEDDLALPASYGDDRLFCVYTLGDQPPPNQLEALEEDHPVIRIRVAAPQAIGAEMYRWEMATAVLGYLLDVNPFDQPDVESAKVRTQELLSSSSWIRPDAGSASDLLATLAPPSYVAIQAFVTPSEHNAQRLRAVRNKLRDTYRVAVTAGFGPRYLHSTGQFHKGGPDSGVFLQVTGPHETDVDVPGAGYTFGRLIDAQADGDLAALRDAGRGVARVSMEELERLASS